MLSQQQQKDLQTNGSFAIHGGRTEIFDGALWSQLETQVQIYIYCAGCGTVEFGHAIEDAIEKAIKSGFKANSERACCAKCELW